MVFHVRRAVLYHEEDDYELTDDEDTEKKVYSSDEDEEPSEDEDNQLQRAARMDEANIELIKDKDLKEIVEMTNEREKQVFTGKGKDFAYPTEWKSDEGCGVIRFKIHMLMDGLVMRLLAMILVIVDIALVIYSVVETTNTAIAIVSLIIVTYFLIDLILRIFAWGKTFFKDWLEVFDGVVVIVTFVVTVVMEVMYFTSQQTHKYLSLIVILRFVRFFLYIRIFYHTGQSIYMALRYKATREKKRYVQDGYDLDLTYITENVIAMSFPSSGVGEIRSLKKRDFELALRNPKEEVARFFNEKYPNGHYKIYNLCRERGYDTSVFNDQVARYKIDDHNVPKMSELLAFCQDVDDYMKKDPENNVIAVHCKGGKGRTGCCIASWLIYSGQWKTAKRALDYFGGRRMDVAKGVKFQGVETPSQKRYVRYLETLITKMGGKMPPPKELIVKSVEIKGLDDLADSDLRMEIVIDDVTKYKIPIISKNTKKGKGIFMKLQDNVRIVGDVKFRFKSKKLGRDYDNCAFFFWIHTSFEKKNFIADRSEIGNANKPKHFDKYTEQFRVKVSFADPAKGRSGSRKQKSEETKIDIPLETDGGNAETETV